MISGRFSEIPFNSFVTQIESSYPVRFFYKKEWMDSLRLVDFDKKISLSEVLDSIFKRSQFHYFIEETGNILITKDHTLKLLTDKPEESEIPIPLPATGRQDDNIPLADNKIEEIGNPAEKNRPGNVVINGYITDRDNMEPLAGITVYVQELGTGTISNGYGFYSLNLPRGNHTIKFTSIGMKEKKATVKLYGSGELNIEMSGAVIPLKEVVVSVEKNVKLHQYETGLEKINMTSFKLMPTSMGESDLIKSILLIPGVQSAGEGSAGFYVRGGSADQNLILLYGAPVYNTSHLFGFFSTINPDIIKDITLYKGGIPGRYGGRISSVLDIGSKEGRRDKFGGTAGISPITTHLLVEGPILKDKLTYLLSLRTTYSDWIFKYINDPALQMSKASFYDLNGKITYDINKKNKIDLSTYYSEDSFRFNSDTLYNYNNKIVAFQWKHFYNNHFFSSITLNSSSYNYNISSNQIAKEAFNLSHRIRSDGFKADFNLFSGRKEINFGVDLTRYSVSPGNFLPYSDSSLITPNNIEKEQAVEGSVYADGKFILTRFLSVNLGMRFSVFYNYGPQTVMIYDPAVSKSRSTITDSISYKQGEIISKYGGPELRAALNFRISDNNSFKLNYNRTRQYLHLLTNSTSISPTDIWKLSDYYIKPQVGDQVAAGFYQKLQKKHLEASIEVYYKWISNMIDFKGGTNLIMNDIIEKDIINVNGKAYGLEFVIKKTEGKFLYSVGYTYSRIFIKSMSGFKEELINSGKWFPASFDRPNDLVITANYLISRRFSFSGNYIWSTGRPITYPVATYYLDDNLVIHYSDRNKYRVPYYSRLDLSVKISGNLRSRKIAHPSWTFSVYNLLGRQNVYSEYFRKSEDIIKGYRLSVFANAIPSVTFSFDF